jgi:hypothetical protein
MGRHAHMGGTRTDTVWDINKVCWLLNCSGIIAQLIRRSSHGTICNRVQIFDSAWPAPTIIGGRVRIPRSASEKGHQNSVISRNCMARERLREREVSQAPFWKSDQPRLAADWLLQKTLSANKRCVPDSGARNEAEGDLMDV